MKFLNYLNELSNDVDIVKELTNIIRERGEGELRQLNYKIKSYNTSEGFTLKYLNDEHLTELLLKICKRENLSCSTEKQDNFTLFNIEMRKPV